MTVQPSSGERGESYDGLPCVLLISETQSRTNSCFSKLQSLAAQVLKSAGASASATWPWPACWATNAPHAARPPSQPSKPLAPEEAPHFAPRRRSASSSCSCRVSISQMDTWEYKPRGPEGRRQDRPRRRHPHRLQVCKFQAIWPDRHLGSPSCFPHIAKHVDKLCFLRGLFTDTPGPSAGGDSTAHRHRSTPRLTRPSHRLLVASTAWAAKTRTCPATSPSTRPPNFGGGGQLRQRLLAGSLPGHRASTTQGLPARTCRATTRDVPCNAGSSTSCRR